MKKVVEIMQVNIDYKIRCPCCNRQVYLKMIEIDGKLSIDLVHISTEATPTDIERSGYELGVIPSGNGGEDLD